nr:13087_t:CDS:2 [Entrophospora candida]
MALDYSSILKTLAREAGVAVPTTAFSKSVLGLSKENGSSDGISKCSKCGEPLDDLLNVSYKWRYLSDGKAPFQGPKTKKVKTGHLVKSAINKTNSVHPQAFYTSRLLHYPNLPEPRNCETFTLFDPTTGEIHSMVRKSTKNRETTDEQKSNKGKERSREDFQTHHGKKDSMTRSMTMGKLDREMLDKIKNDRSSRRKPQKET